jgi:hypothetical protein
MGGMLEITQILFLILKLCHVINWSWPWVCAPLIVWVALKLLGKI